MKKRRFVKKHLTSQGQQGDRTTTNVTLVDYVQIGSMEKGKASEISPNEVFAIPDIPPIAHELRAYYVLAHVTSLWTG